MTMPQPDGDGTPLSEDVTSAQTPTPKPQIVPGGVDIEGYADKTGTPPGEDDSLIDPNWRVSNGC